VLKGLREKFSKPIEDLESDRLRTRVSDFDVTPIAEAPTRTPVVLVGEVQSLQVVPRAGSPSLEVTIDDGSGRAVAVFTGRKRLGGVDCGRRVILEGVGRQDRTRIVLLNPAYTIVE
jgi:hypothetical protein